MWLPILIELKAQWKLLKSDAINNLTVTSRVNFHLAKRKKLSPRSFNAKISASCQWISVTHSGSYKLDKSVLSNASRIVYYNITVTWYNKKSESPKVSSATIMRTRETCKLFCSLTKQSTFRNGTTHSVFPGKCRLKKGAQKFHTGDVSPPRSGKCFLLVEANSLARRPTRSSTQIWRVKGHQHGISALVPQMLYRRWETSHWVGWRREISTISQATIFHPRIKPVLQQIRLLQVAESYCRTLQQNLYIMRFVPTQESQVTPPARQIWVVCALTVT